LQLRTIPLAGLVFVTTLMVACGSAERERQPAPPAPGGFAATQDEIDDAAEDLDQVRTGFLEWYFEVHPVRATELGVYDYAQAMPAMDRAAIQARIDDLLEWLADLEQIRFDLMRGADRYDYAVLEYGVRAELLKLEETRDWANDPGLYIDLIARGLDAVLGRQYAPFDRRAGAILGRLGAAADLLDAARDNVSRPPRIWTEMASQSARGLVEYLERDFTASLEAQTARVPQELERARARLVAELEAYIAWLDGELHPRSTGTYRLGRYLLERQLLYGEHISLSLEELERLNLDAINRFRQEMDFTAREIDTGRSYQAILDSLLTTGPAPRELLARARDAAVAARDWTVESGVVPLLRSDLPMVREAPPFVFRQLAAMDGPGPFAPDSLAAYFTVTPPRPEWDEARARTHMAYFNEPGVVLTALHNTFPGHWVQQQHARELTELRRVFATRSLSAGWAHYATGMALDEGFSDDPALRLEQMRRALQRHARWYAVVRIHAMSDPLDQVVSGVMEIAHLDEPAARAEVLRATREPGLIADALGRMQIQELRRDYQEYRAEQEEPFVLADFHAELLRLGLPFPLAREIMIPRDPPRRR
jgi:uncharacterized protein (DUF885 family)